MLLINLDEIAVIALTKINESYAGSLFDSLFAVGEENQQFRSAVNMKFSVK